MVGEGLDECGRTVVIEMGVEPDASGRHGDEAGDVPDHEGEQGAGGTAKGGAERGGQLGGARAGQGLGEGVELEEGGLGDVRGRGLGFDELLVQQGDVGLRPPERDEGQRPEGAQEGGKRRLWARRRLRQQRRGFRVGHCVCGVVGLA